MLVNKPLAPANNGSSGLAMVQSAENLESVLWEQVLGSMTKTVTGGSALGVGSNLYNGIATHALATSMFKATDTGLTQEIVSQLNHKAPQRSPIAPMTAPGSTLSSIINMSHTAITPSTVDSISALSPSALTSYEHLPMVQRAVAYAKSVWPMIEQSAAALHVPPVAILAQSALETGWGASAPGNNLFGVKSIPGQAATTDATEEQVGGVMVPTTANFAAYSSLSDSVAHYTNLIRNVYSDAIGSTSVEQYGAALLRGGYMTDTGYVQKLVSVSQSPIMQTVLDAVGAATP